MNHKKAILIVLDGVGVGNAPDADAYGDAGANTLGSVARIARPSLPNLSALGLAHITGSGLPRPETVCGAYGRLTERSAGKDTTTGHWEMAGLPLLEPFPTFPNGFPAEIIDALARRSGRGIIGNCVASGTEILESLGAEHMATGRLIVYTSADSVLQIAAHEAVVPPEALWRICEAAREVLTGPYAVGRVIARPFVGEPGAFTRTARRRDFSMPPPKDTLLDCLCQEGLDVVGIGKIEDIFAHRGLTRSDHASGNAACIAATLSMLEEPLHGLIFANLVDFDMLYGHRRDAHGFASALEEVDRAIPAILSRMGPDDLLLFTADHGCDPAFRGTDHTRESVPLLCYRKRMRSPTDLGTRGSFADIAATLLSFFGLPQTLPGESFLSQLEANI